MADKPTAIRYATATDLEGSDGIVVDLEGPAGGTYAYDLEPPAAAALAAELLRALYRRADRMVDGALWDAIETLSVVTGDRDAARADLEDAHAEVAELRAKLEEARA